MATLNSAVQSLIDNLHSKMTSGSALSAEEQTLIAAAIDKLSSHGTWEQALTAVAEEHLNAATTHMSQTLTTATSALTNAQSDINTAKDSIQTQNANLALIPDIQTNVESALSTFEQNNANNLTFGLASVTRRVFGHKLIESVGTGSEKQRSQSAFAVYSDNGETHLLRPSTSIPNNTNEYGRLEYLKIAADGSAKTTIKSHFLHGSTFYASPSTYIYRYGVSAFVPLASKDDANDIEFETVYSTQTQASTSSSHYGGIYTATAGNTTITKPKANIDAADQWGLSTITNHNWATAATLYDNAKHCLVMVDSSTSLIVEKYRDGNVVTETSIANAAALQSYVDNGDFTVVHFIIHSLGWPRAIQKNTFGTSNTSNSNANDMFGFYGKSGSAIQMGGQHYCAHYRYSADKKLIPLNYYFCSSTTPHRTQGSSGTANSIGDLYVTLQDFSGNTLGSYHYQSKSDYAGYQTGYIGGALICMNPFSHVGVLNDGICYNSTQPYYGQGRICKAF